MAYKLTWYPNDGKAANLIDYVIVNQTPPVSIEDTKVYRGGVIDAKSKDHYVVV